MITTWKIENITSQESFDSKTQAEVIWTCDVNNLDINTISENDILQYCEQSGLDKVKIEEEVKIKVTLEEYKQAQKEGRITRY
jgi:hypothetical protein